MAKILVVDDDPSTLHTLHRTFVSAGHHVIASEDPLAALQVATQDPPDAITIDAVMPELDGWELLRSLRANVRTADVPILMLTALEEVVHRVRGLRSGADDYIVKPFAPDELLARVEGLLLRRPPAIAATIAELERRRVAGRSLDGVRLGRYEVLEQIGSGAMGRVFHGWDPKLQRPVALKTIRFDRRKSDPYDDASRLVEEAIAGARFNHPNIVTVYDVGDHGDAAFIAMEMIDGISLEERLACAPRLTPGQVVPLAAAITRALAVAHEHELLHRDVKPANVLLGRNGSIKVTDFGIAEWISRTGYGRIFGTPGYLAPECLAGFEATVRSDLFAVGVVLYQCMTGRHPFAAGSWQRTLRNVSESEVEPIRYLNPSVPEPICELAGHLLSKDPARRPSNASEVAALFEAFAAEQQLSWSFDLPSGAGRQAGETAARRSGNDPSVGIQEDFPSTVEIRDWPG